MHLCILFDWLFRAFSLHKHYLLHCRVRWSWTQTKLAPMSMSKAKSVKRGMDMDTT